MNGRALDTRVAEQFQRIVNSVTRLTQGTSLQGTVVRLNDPVDPERLALTVSAPTGRKPFKFYEGILLWALESWTDDELDRRLYQSSEPTLRHLLNPPEGVLPVRAPSVDIPPASEPSSPGGFKIRWSGWQAIGCSECRAFRQEIEFHQVRLRAASLESKRISARDSAEGLEKFVNTLVHFLELQARLDRVKTAFASHRKRHRLVM